MIHMEMIKKACNAQALDPMLWAIKLDSLQTIQEAALQEALRDLHRVVEDQDEKALKRIMDRAFDL